MRFVSKLHKDIYYPPRTTIHSGFFAERATCYSADSPIASRVLAQSETEKITGDIHKCCQIKILLCVQFKLPKLNSFSS